MVSVERAASVRVEDGRLIYFYILFSFTFSYPFIFLFLDLELRVSIILYMTVTNCYMSLSHDHISQKNIKDSGIMMLYHISFRVG